MFWFQKYHNTLCLSLHNFASVLLLFSLGTIVSPRRKWKQCLCKILEVQTKSILVFLKVAYVALNFCGFGLGFVTILNFFVVRIINSVFKFLKSGINKFISYEIHIHMFCFQKYHNTLCLSLHNFASVLLLFSLGTKVSPRRKWKQCLCKILEVQTKSILVFLKVAYVALNFVGLG